MDIQTGSAKAVDLSLEEKRAARIKAMEQYGDLVPGCAGCERHLYPYYRTMWTPGKFGPHAPSHKPSKRCESGGHAHCTCDTCF